MASEGKTDTSEPNETPDKTEAPDPMANAHKAIKDVTKGLEEDSKDLFTKLRQATDDSDPDANFTWAHFFTKHCGILPNDALKYETSLIAHRMDPLNTLIESFALIIQYGRIPIGDKLKIKKTIERKEKELEDVAKSKEDAKKALGLEKFNDFEAGCILDLAGGDTEYHIEYGIEQFEDGKREMERMVNIAMVKDPKSAEMYNLGSSVAKQLNDPTFKFLSSFGYRTFEYTKSKSVAESTVPTSTNHIIEDALFIADLDLNKDTPDTMYT